MIISDSSIWVSIVDAHAKAVSISRFSAKPLQISCLVKCRTIFVFVMPFHAFQDHSANVHSNVAPLQINMPHSWAQRQFIESVLLLWQWKWTWIWICFFFRVCVRVAVHTIYVQIFTMLIWRNACVSKWNFSLPKKYIYSMAKTRTASCLSNRPHSPTSTSSMSTRTFSSTLLPNGKCTRCILRLGGWIGCFCLLNICLHNALSTH